MSLSPLLEPSPTVRAPRLAFRIIGWQLLFTTLTAIALYQLAPFLLLLTGEISQASAYSLTFAVLFAAIPSIFQGWLIVWHRRSLLQQIAERSFPVQQFVLPKLNDDPWLIVSAWAGSSACAVLLALTAFRPSVIPPWTAFTLGVFAAVVIASASLPLLMLIRRDFVRVMESIPPDVVSEIIDAQVGSGRLRGRTSRRLLAAIVTPVAFVSVGAALITGAHLRAQEESFRKEIAQQLIPAVLHPLSSNSPWQDEKQLYRAQERLAQEGYRTHLRPDAPPSSLSQNYNGLVTLQLPLPPGSIEISFLSSTIWPVPLHSLLIILCALAAAGGIGVALGRLLSRDLRMANHGVRMLGTDVALDGTRVMSPARFQAVAELGSAIELLASRFRIFAQAQQRSIEAREAAISARGRFFASVSHDLRSPLNAILGFAELTRRDALMNDFQRESLDLIIQRGRELLGLIETILDAARIEAGQLTLDSTEEHLEDLLELAITQATHLSPDSNALVVVDAPDSLPQLTADRHRLSQALATFLAHARRTAERDTLRLLIEIPPLSAAQPFARRTVSLFIEIPSTAFSARELSAMINPEEHPGQHRGLAMALRLAKSIIELHGGQVSITGRTVREPAFAITLRTRPGH